MSNWHVTPLKDTDLTVLELLTPAATGLKEATLDHAVSAWVDDELIGCGGVQELWPGVGNAWLVLVPGRLKGPARLRHGVRTMRALLEAAMVERGMWRIQAACHADWEMACNLADVLGGEKEGLMRQYGPDGTDFWLYAWVRRV